jgi:hypothetical protein
MVRRKDNIITATWRPLMLMVRRKDNIITATWRPLMKSYTKIRIKYCPKEGGSCKYHIVKDQLKSETSFSVEDKSYGFTMEVFDGEDLVYSSPQVRVQATDGPGRRNGGMIAGIDLTVIILIAVIVVIDA